MISRRSFAYSSMTRRASSSLFGFDAGCARSGSSRGFFDDQIVGMSYLVGGCNPGEFTHSSRRVAASACPALRSNSSLTRPGGIGSCSCLFGEQHQAFFDRLNLFETPPVFHVAVTFPLEEVGVLITDRSHEPSGDPINYQKSGPASPSVRWMHLRRRNDGIACNVYCRVSHLREKL
jgi:hypothetical protein